MGLGWVIREFGGVYSLGGVCVERDSFGFSFGWKYY